MSLDEYHKDLKHGIEAAITAIQETDISDGAKAELLALLTGGKLLRCAVAGLLVSLSDPGAFPLVTALERVTFAYDATEAKP